MEDTVLTTAELNEGFVVAIEIVAKDGEEEAVGRALEALIKPTMAEPGIKLFLPYRSPTDPKAFFVFELYQGEEGRAAHEKTEHFKAFVRRCRASLRVGSCLMFLSRRSVDASDGLAARCRTSPGRRTVSFVLNFATPCVVSGARAMGPRFRR